MKNEPSISMEQLIEWNKQGLIPGPKENEAAYAHRVDYCLNLKKQIHTSSLKKEIPLDKCEEQSPQITHEAKVLTHSLYDFTMDWIPLFFSNHKLAFWHGGCAWIFQETENSPIGAILQLRKSWHKNPKNLAIYSRNELVGHELAHAGRMAFEEPQFEEVLAYQTSTSSFRKWFGPIIQSSKEAMAFFLSLFLIFLVDLIIISSGEIKLYQSFLWLKLIPVIMIIYGLYRLSKKQKIFQHCAQKLKEITQDLSIANAIIYRLTDEEIHLFATLSSEKIKEFAKLEADKSLRWKLIFHSYFAKF